MAVERLTESAEMFRQLDDPIGEASALDSDLAVHDHPQLGKMRAVLDGEP